LLFIFIFFFSPLGDTHTHNANSSDHFAKKFRSLGAIFTQTKTCFQLPSYKKRRNSKLFTLWLLCWQMQSNQSAHTHTYICVVLLTVCWPAYTLVGFFS
jgi:hypothetical protein